MKFKHVPIGAEFLLNGVSYIKSTPLLAKAKESGVNKIMRQSMDVDTLEDTNVSDTSIDSKSLNVFSVRSAFNQFYAECEAMLGQLGKRNDRAAILQVKKNLAQARQRFFRCLNTSHNN